MIESPVKVCQAAIVASAAGRARGRARPVPRHRQQRLGLTLRDRRAVPSIEVVEVEVVARRQRIACVQDVRNVSVCVPEARLL